jgi:hypothetical protein
MGALHGSLDEVGAAAATVGTAPTGSVGSDKSVGLGSGDGLGSGVGGTSVAVGIAACVSATIVLAAATAEAWICAGSAVGTAGAQAALMATISAARTSIVFLISQSPVRERDPRGATASIRSYGGVIRIVS